MSPLRFGVVVPVFNEPRLARLLARFDFSKTPDVVVVDDGSTDGSVESAANVPVTLVRHGRRRGVGAAIRTGLQELRRRGLEIGVVMAGNNKDDPAEISRLLSAIEIGADYVQGSRYLDPNNARDTPLRRRILTRGASLLWSVRFARRLTDVTNGFRAYRLSLLDDPAIDADQSWLDRYELEYYLHYKVLTLGYRLEEVAVSKRYPADGLPTTKIRLWRDSWSLIRPLVLLSLGVRR